MFCADYIASFIHHGFLVGLWCEFKKRQNEEKIKDEKLTTQDVPAYQSFLVGCLSGNLEKFY